MQTVVCGGGGPLGSHLRFSSSPTNLFTSSPGTNDANVLVAMPGRRGRGVASMALDMRECCAVGSQHDALALLPSSLLCTWFDLTILSAIIRTTFWQRFTGFKGCLTTRVPLPASQVTISPDFDQSAPLPGPVEPQQMIGK
jgi:hypothetical protein